jgi:hypothetical protein
MPDPVFGDTVWYVLGTGTVDGEMFAEYAQEVAVSFDNPLDASRFSTLSRS